MIKHNQKGGIGGLALTLILVTLLLIGAVAFGFWAYSGRQDYKDNVDAKITEAVDKAKEQANAAKDAQFLQDEKKPLRTYTGPDAYGSLVINYPKTWSGLMDIATQSGSAVVNGYFYPGVVPSITNRDSSFALRVQIVNQSYAQTLTTIASLQKQKAPPTIVAYALPLIPKTVGVKVSGTLPEQKNGIMVVLPLRAQTLKIWTEGSQFADDFNNSILPNFSFTP